MIWKNSSEWNRNGKNKGKGKNRRLSQESDKNLSGRAKIQATSPLREPCVRGKRRKLSEFNFRHHHHFFLNISYLE